MVKESTVKVKGVLEGPSAESFAKYPGELRVFVDGKKIYATQKPVSPFTVDVPLQSSKKPVAIVFNWDTEYGPIAVAAFRLQQVLPQAANSSR
ncbi:hypothetical protein L0244_18775 [bacterium]|nr:hypothetical protein [bacterium]MCI0615040.1 hypothetical protein [bacterium]